MAMYGGGLEAAGAMHHDRDDESNRRESFAMVSSDNAKAREPGILGSLTSIDTQPSEANILSGEGVVEETYEHDRLSMRGLGVTDRLSELAGHAPSSVPPDNMTRNAPSTQTDAHVVHDDRSHLSGVTVSKLMQRPSAVEALGMGAKGSNAAERSVNSIPHAKGQAPNRGDVWSSLFDCCGKSASTSESDAAWANMEEEAMTGSDKVKHVINRKTQRRPSEVSDDVAGSLVNFAKKAKMKSKKKYVVCAYSLGTRVACGPSRAR